MASNKSPLLNIPFSVEARDNNLWVTFGDFTYDYNPYPLNKRGISHLIDEDWVNIPYDSIFEARSLNNISINPNNTNAVAMLKKLEEHNMITYCAGEKDKREKVYTLTAKGRELLPKVLEVDKQFQKKLFSKFLLIYYVENKWEIIS